MQLISNPCGKAGCISLALCTAISILPSVSLILQLLSKYALLPILISKHPNLVATLGIYFEYESEFSGTRIPEADLATYEALPIVPALLPLVPIFIRDSSRETSFYTFLLFQLLFE